MSVTGKRARYLAAVILGREFTYRKLTWDDALVAGLVEAEKNFWNGHVVPGILPKPDGSKICDKVLARYFHTAKMKAPLELVGFDDKLKRREEILATVKKLQEEQSQIEQEVKLFMKDHEKAASSKYQITWANVSSVRLDTKRIKEEQPGLYQDYAKASSSRHFQVKAA